MVTKEPDPLGRRAVYWVTPKETTMARPKGRAAFYTRPDSDTESLQAGGSPGATPGASTATRRSQARNEARAQSGPAARSAGTGRTGDARTGREPAAGQRWRSPFGRPTGPSRPGNAPRTPLRVQPGASRQTPTGIHGVDVCCRSCGDSRVITVPEFIMLHWPFWIWLPGKGYTRLIRCPGCGERSWISASWPSVSAKRRPA